MNQTMMNRKIMNKTKNFIIFTHFLILTVPILATEKIYSSKELNGSSIIIDGSLDEPIWESAGFRLDFIQREPIENEKPSEKTEFSVCYDHDNLYVGIKAYYEDQKTIKSVLTRRDEWSPSDWVYVFIDSYKDNRTAFQFGLNPVGVKRDIRWSDDENPDRNWDAVWEGETTYFDGGWSAEFEIPFRELRFDKADSQIWGFQIKREIANKNEEDYWTFWSKDEQGFVRHFGELNNLNNIPQQKHIQLIPYTTGQLDHSKLYKNPVHPKNYNLSNIKGLDVKFGVTNNLTLDITINPDFGQVEADPAELNLSAFESYFDEKRPFFVEGGNIFNYALGMGDGDQSQNSLFYTRRIGRSPHYSAYWGEYGDGYITEPNSTRILGAAKLSGKTSSGWSIGILDGLTAEENAHIEYQDSSSFTQTIEPLTNYSVNRIQRDFRDGKTTVGGMVTAVNRKIDKKHLDWLHSDAYSAGLDFSHLFFADSYMIFGGAAFTDVIGTPDAIINTQRSSNHYYQRSDAPHLNVDSSATHLTGFSENAGIFKVNGDWRWGIGQWVFSPGFEANDLGYHRSVDNQVQFLWFSRQENEPGKYLRDYRSNMSIWHSTNFGYESHPIGGNVNFNLTLLNYWNFGAGVNYDGPGIHTNALWGGPAIKTDGGLNGWFFVGSDQNKDLFINFNGYRGTAVMGSKWAGINSNINWRPTTNIFLRFSINYNHQTDTWSNWSGYEPSYDIQNETDEYLLAHFDQKTLSSTFRLDWTLTPDLSFQYYGSPFVTAGKYDRFIKLIDPKGDNYDERFYSYSNDEMNYNEDTEMWEIDENSDGILNYSIPNLDFNYRQFNSNLVLRWEYRSGSTLYLVWSQGITDFVDISDFSYGNDLRDLFGADQENIFLIKFNYLFNL